MLEKLTPEQEAAIPAWREQWLRIGLATRPAGQGLAPDICEIIDRVYAAGGLPPPARIIACASPFALARLAQAVRDGNPIPPTPGAQMAADGPGIYRDFGYGSMDAGWLSYYQFFREKCGIKTRTDLDPLVELAGACGWWAPFDTACVVSELPTEIHRDAQNRLHREGGGAAIAYSDGSGVWCLRGVRFPESERRFVELPVDSIAPDQVLAIENVDRRAAVIARVGIARMMEALRPEVVDSASIAFGGEYALLRVSIRGTPRLYLRMIYPHHGDIMLEAVAPDCRTVRDALIFRTPFHPKGTPFVPPTVLT